MSDLKNFLRDAGYFTVGAAAVILEAGGKAVKCLVRKGEKVLTDNQETVDEIKRQAKAAGEKIKGAVQDLNKKDEAPETEDFPETDAPEVDTPDAEEPAVEETAAEEPVTPDAIYRTEEPAPAAEEEPKPEETVNG